MPQSDAQDRTTTVLTMVTGFLQRHRRLLVTVLIAVVVIVAGLLIYLEVRASREQSSRIAVEEVQDLYDQWNEAADDQQQQRLAEQIQSKVDEIVSTYPRFYAAQRALMVRADLHWQRQQWQHASEDYAEAANGFHASYLTPISLFNAAAAAEQAGEPDRARELLQQLVDNHDSVEVPRALFSLGRLAESDSQTAEALEYYNRLVDNHPGSNWTNLARNRIIALSIQE